jgi:hypothetical protein
MIGRLLGPLLGRRVDAPFPLPHGAELRRGRWLPAVGGRLAGMGGRAAAVTIGRAIVVHPDQPLDARLLRHELAHAAQWRRAPLTFPFRYVIAHLRHGYAENPYEIEARRAESHATSGEATK